MSYRDRLREMQYTAPSGASFTLLFDELTREVGKKAPVTEFPQQNAGAVQDLGQTTPRYPMTIYISGPDYDAVADRFWDALNESGSAGLSHPRFGDLRVVPVSASQTEQFVEGAGRALFRVEFVQADDEQFDYPDRVAFSPASVYSQADVVSARAAAVADVAIEEPGRLAALKDSALETVDTVTGAFDRITGVTDDVRQSINSTVNEITSSIDDLVQAPADLAGSLLTLYRLPARTITSVRDKVNGYRQILSTLATGFVDTTQQYGELFGLINQASAAGVAAAAAEASAEGELPTRASAADVSDTLSGIADQYNGLLESSPVVDYELQAATRQALTNALRSLQERALNLPIEQSETLTADECTITLVDRLYSDVNSFDGTLDAFIEYNGLQGEEIFIVPAGRTVRWYE